MTNFWMGAIILALLLAGCTTVIDFPLITTGNWSPITRVKYLNCSLVNFPYPDYSCSPGAVFQNVTVEQICTSGYASSVRDVSESLKSQVYTEYGIYSHQPYEYEIDHIISLELGGSNDIANLYPEKYDVTLGAHAKDKVENLLHKMVCEGQISLQQAQYDIVYNWTKYVS